MENFNPYKLFQSGKHYNKTYWWVWLNDRSYLYFLAGQYQYWHDVVEMLEHRDRFISGGMERRRPSKSIMSTEEFRAFFKQHPILGFDMSDHLASIYDGLNELEKEEYFQSLKQKNNIQ